MRVIAGIRAAWCRGGVAVACLVLAGLTGCAAPAHIGESDRARIAGRTFVVTGASSGLGRGVAIKLAAYGGNVVLAARRGAVLDTLANQLQAAGGHALVVPTDVSRPDDVQHLATAATERFGRVDVWINDAGVAAIGPFEEVPIEDHARVVDVNLKGYLFGSHAALRLFRRQGFGTLVNVASVEGRIPLAYHASYAATKAAILALDAALTQELRLSGADEIKVVSVLPWALDTPFWEHTANYSGGTPRIASMDDPQATIDAVVWATIHPVKEVAPGFKAQAALLGDQLWPALAERAAANVVHRSQFETAPPAPPTTGSLYVPMEAGTTAEGDARARMAEEDREHRANRR